MLGIPQEAGESALLLEGWGVESEKGVGLAPGVLLSHFLLQVACWGLRGTAVWNPQPSPEPNSKLR